MEEEEEENTTDRISTLPVFILHHILSYLLEDTKSLVRMSVLSKEWFSLTASFPLLYFRIDYICRSFPVEYGIEYAIELIYRYLEYTVSRFCDQNVSAHTFNFFTDVRHLGQIQRFGHCLELVLERGLQVLVIDAIHVDENLPMFRLPKTLLSTSSLTSLTLSRCELPSTLMVAVVQLKSLRLLSLSNLLIDEGVIGHLTNGCPLLKEMFILDCHGFRILLVKRHHNLHKVEIYCGRMSIVDKIGIDAPNLSCFLFESNANKASLCLWIHAKKLTTFGYRGLPTNNFNDFLSSFPFIENVLLNLSFPVDKLKLSHHFLKRLELETVCNLEEIYLNAPNLLMFKCVGQYSICKYLVISRNDSSSAKRCMKCRTGSDFDIQWFQKLRRFLERNSIFKVSQLVIDLRSTFKDVKELELIQSPPYELVHIKIKEKYFTEKSPRYLALVDAVLWCFRPRSLTIEVDHLTERGDIIVHTYNKLLQQEDEGQTIIKFVLVSTSKEEQHISDLNSLLTAIPLNKFKGKITFIKEAVVQDTSTRSD